MDEYISREAALKKLQMQLLDLEADQDKGEYSELCENRGARDALDGAIYDIRTLKAADVQPVKQWVRLHDKHPDTEGFYLVCDQYGECEVVEYLPDIKSWFTHKIKGEIQYWMSLPEPPKDGDTNGT